MPEFDSLHPNADVRMRGFAERATVADALAWLDAALARLRVLDSEMVPLHAATGRVLAEEVISSVNVPEFRRAMMDGYALRAVDIESASAENVIALQIIADCVPGESFDGELSSGQAVRIMTGAALPAGVDAVLPVEFTRLSDDRVLALRSVPAGKHCGRVGEDIGIGEVVLRVGRELRPQDIGLLASIGRAEIQVVRRPRVSIVVTGNELLPAGEVPRGNRIVDANGPMLRALVQRDGGDPHSVSIVADDRDTILAALGEEADLVITSGGSSVGQEDHVPTLLAEYGELAIHGVSTRPGGPMGMGVLNGRLTILLSGNPVACLWAYDLFAGRAIRSLGGRHLEWPYRMTPCELASDIDSVMGRIDYVRVVIEDGIVSLVENSGASILSSTTRADGFLVVPSDVGNYASGSLVDVFLYD